MNSISQLQPGYYGELTGYPFQNPTKGGLSWSGNGRSCGGQSGWFVIDNISYANGVLTAIDARFEQRCGTSIPALHGQVHWTANDTSTPPGPVNPPPLGLWSAPAGSIPATGNYVYLKSDAGDYIGGGQQYSYTDVNATIKVTPNGGRLSVSVGGWDADFKTMDVLSQLQVGYYGGLLRYPFHNQVKGGLNWSGNGRGCNTLTGWFVVDSVGYQNGALKAIDLRFEQHCEGGTSALRGQIHWVSP